MFSTMEMALGGGLIKNTVINTNADETDSLIATLIRDCQRQNRTLIDCHKTRAGYEAIYAAERGQK